MTPTAGSAPIVPPEPERGGQRPGRVPDLTVPPEFFEPLPAQELEAWGGPLAGGGKP